VAHADDVKRKVRANYVQGLPLKAASETEGVSYNTARNWKRDAVAAGDDWDVERTARRLTASSREEMAHQVMPQLTRMFAALMKKLEDSKDIEPALQAKLLLQITDGYAKAAAASERLAPGSNRLATAMDVIRFVTDLVANHLPKMHPAFFELVRTHGEDIAREFGGSGRR
jgi:hypothetical protein